MKTKVALAAAIVLAMVAMVGIYKYLNMVAQQAEQEKKTLLVMVARANLRSGRELLPGDADPEAKDAASVPRDVLMRGDMQRYYGRKVTRDIPAGEMLQKSDFWQERGTSEFQKNEIEPGERAITLAVDQITGVSGLILPHSRVDVLGTFAVAGAGGMGGPQQTNFITRTLLSNVKVLAIDRQTSTQNAPLGPDESMRSGSYSSVTLAVSPLEAQILTLAQSRGQGMLTLVLRNPVDPESSVGVPPVDMGNIEEAVRQADLQRHKSGK